MKLLAYGSSSGACSHGAVYMVLLALNYSCGVIHIELLIWSYSTNGNIISNLSRVLFPKICQDLYLNVTSKDSFLI